MKPLISALAITAGIALSAPAVQASEVCMNADEMAATLIDWYGEAPVAAPDENGEQIWASSATGTWTMIRTFSDGNACVLAQGDDWTPAGQDNQIVAQLSE